jgi:hypothetical protein
MRRFMLRDQEVRSSNLRAPTNFFSNFQVSKKLNRAPKERIWAGDCRLVRRVLELGPLAMARRFESCRYAAFGGATNSDRYAILALIGAGRSYCMIDRGAT